jgi:hypothetical protein
VSLDDDSNAALLAALPPAAPASHDFDGAMVLPPARSEIVGVAEMSR